jgi:hypothetical protein
MDLWRSSAGFLGGRLKRRVEGQDVVRILGQACVAQASGIVENLRQAKPAAGIPVMHNRC